MDYLYFPDWENIGRRIGKRLKGIFTPPSEDHGPSKDERRAQRLQDVLRGFAYFDSFDEVEGWNVQEVDPMQQANTPLLKRPKSDQADQKSKLLLCHDYSGNYHDDESSARPFAVTSELYSCEYLKFVDTFVYFSHKLVCLPPPSWTNTLHRNGVKVLGTFILEPQTPVERSFTKIDGKYLIAEQLAKMASAYNFEGYLLNFEKEFPTNSSEEILGFVTQLKEALGNDRIVIWYDSLDIHNVLNYQNGLSTKNLDFSLAAGSLFTNYKWTIEKLIKSKELARNSHMDTADVSFGLDTWAQNTDMPGPPRITFPPDSGGGTSLGFATGTLARTEFSTAVFGPAWVYEHFSANISPSVDRSVWEGATLPIDLGCDCKKGKPHHTMFYQSNPLVAFAREYPAGSSTFFDSNFKRAFQDMSSENERCYFPILGSQAPYPNLLPMSMTEWEKSANSVENRYLYGELGVSSAENLGQRASCLKVFTKVVGSKINDSAEAALSNDHSTLSPRFTHRLCLFKLAMDAENIYLVTVDFNRMRQARSASFGLYIASKRSASGTSELKYEDHDLLYNATTAHFTTNPEVGGLQLREVGVYCRGSFESLEPSLLIEMTRLVIRRKPLDDSPEYDFIVENLGTKLRGDGPHQQQRLVWEWRGARHQWPVDLPWSEITGPFSHFTIMANERVLGDAYCLEYPLLKEDFLPSSPAMQTFSVIGNVFGGFFTISSTASLKL